MSSKILLIENDPVRSSPLIQALEEAGLRVALAPSGVYALTMIERDRPDLILAPTRLEDMTTAELASIIRADTTLEGVRIVVLAPGGTVSEGQYEAVLKDSLAPGTVAQKVRTLATWNVVSHDFAPRPSASAAELSARSKAKPDRLCGSLDILNLMDLTQAFYHARKSGCLLLEGHGETAQVFFAEGEVIHASFDGLEGRAAFARALVFTEGDEETGFCFAPMSEAELAATPRSIMMTAPQLLLAIVVDLDESKQLELVRKRERWRTQKANRKKGAAVVQGLRG